MGWSERVHSHVYSQVGATSGKAASPPDDGTLLTAVQMRARVGGVSSMCIWRWMRDPRVHFPEPDLTVNNRRYWRLGTIRQWQERMAAQGGDTGDHFSESAAA
jgi:hypothetical protein